MLFEWLKQLIETQDGEILFILTLIAIAMILDFFTGVVASRVNTSEMPVSNKGINGILRKISSLLVMIFFIPVSILIPNNAGVALVYTLYLGYLMMEILSILENLERMGLKTELFKAFLDVLRGKKDEDEKEKINE